jgi:hypothetical protein
MAARCQPVAARCQLVDARCQTVAARCQPVGARCQPMDARCQPMDASCQPIKHHENTRTSPEGTARIEIDRKPIAHFAIRFRNVAAMTHDTYRPFGTTATIGRVTNPGLASGAVACRGFATSPEGTPCDSHGCQPMEPGPTREPGRQTRAPVPKGRHAIAMGANPWPRGANPWPRGANPSNTRKTPR